jgi:hypothetical protein
LIPFVDYARVKKIKRAGLRIEDQQEHGYREYWKQVWWCLPVTDEQTEAPSEQATQAYDATRQRESKISRFRRRRRSDSQLSLVQLRQLAQIVHHGLVPLIGRLRRECVCYSQ